jgi:hypothetical protein
MDNKDPFDLHEQEARAQEKKERELLEQQGEESDVKWLMSNKRGRRIVWRLLNQSGVFRLSFNTDSMLMAFAEGNRNFGNRILTLVHSQCPELYPVMVKEQNNV